MDLIIFVLIVLVCLALVIWALDQVPMNPPINWIVRLLVILLAVVLILHRAGLA